MMVVGMPNVGKSSLINALRKSGVGKGKALKTGDQPGVTRKVATSVKILEGEGMFGGLYLVDTPGVFIPYVPDSSAMLKLALCGSVKDTILDPVIIADYLLYHMNLVDPGLYAQYRATPTNDILPLLASIASKTGRLQKGGVPDYEASALWLMQRWRNGQFGAFCLDDTSEEGLAMAREASLSGARPSLNQAKKALKLARKTKSMASASTAAGGGA